MTQRTYKLYFVFIEKRVQPSKHRSDKNHTMTPRLSTAALQFDGFPAFAAPLPQKPQITKWFLEFIVPSLLLPKIEKKPFEKGRRGRFEFHFPLSFCFAIKVQIFIEIFSLLFHCLNFIFLRRKSAPLKSKSNLLFILTRKK